MQTTSLPSSVCDNIERACRSFIWGSTTNERKLSLVKWNEICQPKSSGGLGLRDMRAMNDAFLMKIGWSLVTKPDSLWVKVLKSKYGIRDDALTVTNFSYSGSYLWRAIARVWNDVQQGIKWSLGKDKMVLR